MNLEKIIQKLSKKYPGKDIFNNNEERPTEIICEIDPTINHPEYSIAIAIIDKSIPHYHKKITEVYELLKGSLVINIDGQDYKLQQGDKLTIEPGKHHFAIGNETWVKVYSESGWTLEDHILID